MQIRWNSFAMFAAFAILSGAARAGDSVTIKEFDAVDSALAKEGGPRFRITGTTYSVEIGADGGVRVLSGQTELLKTIGLEQGQRARLLSAIRRDGDTIRMREGNAAKQTAVQALLGAGSKGNGGMEMAPAAGDLPDLPGMDVRCLTNRLEITLVNLRKGPSKRGPTGKPEPPPSFTVRGVLGGGAVGVKNLRTGMEDVLPARYVAWPHRFSFYGFGGHYWPDLQFVYTNAARLEVRNVGGVDYAAQKPPSDSRGFWALEDVPDKQTITLTILPPDGNGPEVVPAPNVVMRPAARMGFFFENEPVLYHLDIPAAFATPGAWQLDWRIQDHLMRPVAEGSQTLVVEGNKDQTTNLVMNVPVMGWFSGQLTIARPNGRTAPCTREFIFARIRPEIPSARENGRWEDLMGERGLRTGASWMDLGDPYDGSVAWSNVSLAAHGLVGTNAPSQTTLRGEFAFLGAEDLPKHLFEKSDAPALDAQGTKVLKDARDLEAAQLAETLDKGLTKEAPQAKPPLSEKERMEALITQARHDYLVGLARAARKIGVYQWEPVNEPNLGMSPEGYIENILKFQYPAVKEGNPDAVLIGGGICGMENYPWIRRLFELGGQKYFDGIAVHPYTGWGFEEVFRAQLNATWQILRDYHDDKAGIWLTESGWHRGWGYRPYAKDRFGGWEESHARHITDLMLNAEAMGIPRDRVYVFYTMDHGYNEFFLIEKLDRQCPHTAAIALQVLNECLRDAKFVAEEPLPRSGHHFLVFRDKTRTVCAAYTCGETDNLQLQTDAKEVTLTDIMGNRTTVSPQNGRFDIAVSGEPTYLTVKAENRLAPDLAGLKVQPNLALSTLGAVPTASSGVVQPWTCVNGDWTSFESGERWHEAAGGADQYPDWFEVRLAKPSLMARVRVCMDYEAWEKPFKDYEVQVMQGGAWKTVASVHSNLNYNSVLEHTFEPVVSDRVRVLVHAVNGCLFDTLHWLDKSSILQALEVYPPAGAPAPAFFLPEFLQPRLLTPGAATNLVFRLRNATAAKVDGDVRLILPPGVTADANTRPLALEPNGQARCEFRVTMPATIPTNTVYSIVGGFYRGNELASSDYATRVVRCAKPPPPKEQKKKEPPKTAPKKDATTAPKEQPKDALDVIKDAPAL